MFIGIRTGIPSGADNEVNPQIPAAPTIVETPVVSGSSVVGSILSTTDGTWTGTPAPSFSYQWRRDGAAISGAISATYTTVDPTDIGTAVDCLVTATNSAGSASQDSNDITIAAGVTPADFIVTNDAEWDAAITAVVAGQVIEVSGANFTNRQISTVDKGGYFTIRSADSSSEIPALTITNSSNIDLTGLRLIHKDWPFSVSGIVSFIGNVTNVRMWGGEIAHGYGNSTNPDVIANGGLPVPFDTAAQLPEYARTDNVTNAATTSSNLALNWQEPGAHNWGRVTVFNRGTDDVYVKLGEDNTVVATTGDTLVAAGGSTVLTKSQFLGGGINTLPSYIACISVAGTPEINARTEIGLGVYLAAAFQKDGSGVLTNVDFRNLHIHDVRDGFKFGYSGTGIFFNNLIERGYQDAFSFGSGDIPPTSCWILRNNVVAMFARAGRAENLNGDANDPHADNIQFFGNDGVPPFTLENWRGIRIAGNRYIDGNVRADVGGQGTFLSDMPGLANAVYEDVYIVAALDSGGAPRGISIDGKDIYVYDCTTFNADANSQSGTIVSPLDNSIGYVDRSIAEAISKATTNEAGDIVTDTIAGDNVIIDGVTNTHANLFTAFTPKPSTLAEGIAGYTPAPGGAGDGYGAIGSQVVDWTTTDPDQVIKWDLLPAVWYFPEVTGAALSMLTETESSRVMGGPLSGQQVVPDPGVEVQIASDEGHTSIVTAWTSVNTTLNQGQFIKARATSSASNATSVEVGVTINGIRRTSNITTASSPYAQVNASGAFFESVASPSALTNAQKLILGFRGAPDVANPNFTRLIDIDTSLIDIHSLTTGQVRLDLAGNAMRIRLLNALAASGGAAQTTLLTLDLTAATVEEGLVCYRDGVRQSTFSGTPTWTQGASIDLSAGIRTSLLNQAGSQIWNGVFEFLYFEALDAAATLPDLSLAAVRNSFERDFIGLDGSGPTGSQPLFCIFGNASVLNGVDNNRGSAPDLTVTGAFTDA